MQWNDRARVSSLAAMFAAGALAAFVVSGTVITGQRATAPPDAGAMRVLLVKDQIRDQIYNYCRGLDRMDKPLALSVWHPDATVESGGFKGSGPEWIESAWRAHETSAGAAAATSRRGGAGFPCCVVFHPSFLSPSRPRPRLRCRAPHPAASLTPDPPPLPGARGA